MDRAKLLHAAQACGWQVGIGEVCGFLTPTGAAGGGEAWVAGQGGASRGWIVLHGALHAILFEHLFIDKLVVLWGTERQR